LFIFFNFPNKIYFFLTIKNKQLINNKLNLKIKYFIAVKSSS
jgi:hypothetical protein